jgi:hypothetical protein
MRHFGRRLTLLFTLCAACGGKATQVTPLALVPCDIPGVGSPDTLWRQVRASGFTVCVPASWRSSEQGRDSADPQHWSGDGASLTWGLGRPPSLEGQDVRVTGRVVAGRNPRPAPVTISACLRRTTPLAVDGGSLLVTEVNCDGRRTTTAMSTTPEVYVQCEAFTTKGADLVHRVVQTIRFPSNPR